MCLAIFRPPSSTASTVTAEHLTISRQAGNNDGFGLAWVEHGCLNTFKSVAADAWPEFLARVADVQARELATVIHLRQATHGAVTDGNAHPIAVTDKSVIVHNGIIWELSDDADASDTVALAERLRQFPRRWWRNPAVLAVLQEWLGPSNKVAFLHASGDAVLLNATSGLWNNGTWYSNASFVDAPRVSVVPSTLYRDSARRWPDWLHDARPETDDLALARNVRRSIVSTSGYAAAASLKTGRMVCPDCAEAYEWADLTYLRAADVSFAEVCDDCGAFLIETVDDDALDDWKRDRHADAVRALASKR